MGVTARFETFLFNITLTDAQIKAGGDRREAVVGALTKTITSRPIKQLILSTSALGENSLAYARLVM
jgi:hypothetical protein